MPKLFFLLTQYLQCVRDGDVLPQQLYLAHVVARVLGADPVDLQVVLGRQAEPKREIGPLGNRATTVVLPLPHLGSGVTMMLLAVRTSSPRCHTRTYVPRDVEKTI